LDCVAPLSNPDRALIVLLPVTLMVDFAGANRQLTTLYCCGGFSAR
jgi:hypothetical protein